jgi:quercetin dioxygenase-like cupin family protein
MGDHDSYSDIFEFRILIRRKRMSLQVKRENMPEKKVVLKTGEGEGSMIIRQAYGNESSLLVALRPPGYHTRPHMHASEQINHVLEGEIWFFVEDKGYYCKAGDFHRIPANRVHWAWNRSHAITTVVESHSPPLVGGDLRDGAAALFDENESPQLRAEGENKFVQYDSEKVESKYFSGKGR